MSKKNLSIPIQLLLPAKVIHTDENPEFISNNNNTVIIINDSENKSYLKIHNDIVIPIGNTVVNINGKNGYSIGPGYIAILYENLLLLLKELMLEKSKQSLMD